MGFLDSAYRMVSQNISHTSTTADVAGSVLGGTSTMAQNMTNDPSFWESVGEFAKNTPFLDAGYDLWLIGYTMFNNTYDKVSAFDASHALGSASQSLSSAATYAKELDTTAQLAFAACLAITSGVAIKQLKNRKQPAPLTMSFDAKKAAAKDDAACPCCPVTTLGPPTLDGDKSDKASAKDSLESSSDTSLSDKSVNNDSDASLVADSSSVKGKAANSNRAKKALSTKKEAPSKSKDDAYIVSQNHKMTTRARARARARM